MLGSVTLGKAQCWRFAMRLMPSHVIAPRNHQPSAAGLRNDGDLAARDARRQGTAEGVAEWVDYTIEVRHP